MKKHMRRVSRGIFSVMVAAGLVAGSSVAAHADGDIFVLSSQLSSAATAGGGAATDGYYANTRLDQLSHDQVIQGLYQAYSKWRTDRGLYVPQLNDELNRREQTWMDEIAATGVMKHSDPNEGRIRTWDVGENIAGANSTQTPTDIINMWDDGDGGHYALMVQKDVTQVGFGFAKGSQFLFAGMLANWNHRETAKSSMDVSVDDGYKAICQEINSFRKDNGKGAVSCQGTKAINGNESALFMIPTDFSAKGYTEGAKRALTTDASKQFFLGLADGAVLNMTQFNPKPYDKAPMVWVSVNGSTRGSANPVDGYGWCNAQLMFSMDKASQNQPISFCTHDAKGK
ncbi:MAG: CAP domain-containing protein [Corynebacterium sp.]|nr:CAP domain-containing protein [Corynebacterium sp.]